MRPAPPYRIFLGWDPAELMAWNVARRSLIIHTLQPIDIQRIAMQHLVAQHLYTRPTRETDKGYWDEISEAPMSTGHAIARFLVPAICHYEGWALFADGDILVRSDIAELFAQADPQYAIQCVKHHHAPVETVKKDGQIQTSYPRKNWSSVLLFNNAHPANRALTVELVNTVPGRDLHRFCWLEDEVIGGLEARWNVLVGWSPHDGQAALVHYTEGLPNIAGYEHGPYSDEWYEVAAMCGYKLTRPPKVEAVA